jgi:hypothetical protein
MAYSQKLRACDVARHMYLDNVVVITMLAAVLAFVAPEQTRSARDHQHKGFRRHTGVRI